MPDLASFRQAILDRATEGTLADIRGAPSSCPPRRRAEQLRRTIEDTPAHGRAGAVVLPSLLTREDWRSALYADLARPVSARRRVRARGAAAGGRAGCAIAGGAAPPFTIRPGLITEMLGFYDAVRRHGRTVTDFERVAVTALERDVDTDRGAVRMLEQTRFLVAAFRRYEALLADRGLLDEHGLTAAVLAAPASPFTHVVVAVGDRAGDAPGFWPSDFDLLTRVAGLSRLEVVATTAVPAAPGSLERLRRWLPEHEEVSEAPFDSPVGAAPGRARRRRPRVLAGARPGGGTGPALRAR